jgi:hypothetical protein
MPVTMKFPDTCGDISVAGVNYRPTKKGLAKFPDGCIRELLDFGFTVAPPEDSMDEEAAAAYLAAQGLQDQVQAGAEEIKNLNAAAAAAVEALKAIDAQVFGN